MHSRFGITLVTLCFFLASAGPAATPDPLERLAEGDRLKGFRAAALYLDPADRPAGARLIHGSTRMTVDLLRIQTVPQAFFWVRTPPPSDMGEPHTCEHLLLGKGARGRAVAAMEGMLLSGSSAFTDQLETCYHFYTAAGSETFFRLFEAKLRALLQPDFSDEEIRREVCHYGYKAGPAGEAQELEEKGTVYNEMLSAYESPGSRVYRRRTLMLYGPGHPLSNEAGGLPHEIRRMQPEDLRRFHRRTHHLENMGVILVLPEELDAEECLGRLDGILLGMGDAPRGARKPVVSRDELPAPRPAPIGELRLVPFPHWDPDEPAALYLSWPPISGLDAREELLLDLFLALLADGDESELYGVLVDSSTRELDTGASGVWAWTSDDQGHAVDLMISDLDRSWRSEEGLRRIRARVLQEIERIESFPEGSPELERFNGRARNRLVSMRRQMRRLLDHPPRFGFRGTGPTWLKRLRRQNRQPGFHKHLDDSELYDTVDSLLSLPRNLWKKALGRWALLERPPYAVSGMADPSLLSREAEERRKRLDSKLGELQREFGCDTPEDALERFRRDYDRRSLAIDSVMAAVPLPPFAEDPPMGYDERLPFGLEELPCGVPLASAGFEHLAGADMALYHDLRVVPDSLLHLVPALAVLFREAGLYGEGLDLDHRETEEALRREILGLGVHIDSSWPGGRAELVFSAAGSDRDESLAALRWLLRFLRFPDWRVVNLPRLRDLADRRFSRARTVMQRSEESWVKGIERSWRHQRDPLLLRTGSVLSQIHDLRRLRWLLREVEDERSGPVVATALDWLAGRAAGRPADSLRVLLHRLEAALSGREGPAVPRAWLDYSGQLGPHDRKLLEDALRDLGLCLGDTPPECLEQDWSALCGGISRDLLRDPRRTLEDLAALRGLLLHRDAARACLTAGGGLLGECRDSLSAALFLLDPSPVSRAIPGDTEPILERLRDRRPEAGNVVHLGLVNPNKSTGVIISSAPVIDLGRNDPAELLDFVSARTFGGGAGHSLFMKTWAAGLAYSNGIGGRERSGRVMYYAERCPDLAQTVRFVVRELRNTPVAEEFGEYALAQVFSVSRAAMSFSERCGAMAADHVEGLDPELVRRFRGSVIALREDPRLVERLAERVEEVYGRVLPGLGAPMQSAKGAVCFIIGPERQFELWEDYLAQTEREARLYRLYPRDFWILGR